MPEEKKKWVCKCGHKNNLFLDKCIICNECRSEDAQVISIVSKSLSGWKRKPEKNIKDNTNLVNDNTDDNYSRTMNNEVIRTLSENEIDSQTSRINDPQITDSRRNWFGEFSKEIVPGKQKNWSFIKQNYPDNDVIDNISPLFEEDIIKIIDIIGNGTEEEVDEISRKYISRASSEDLQILNQFYKEIKGKELFRRIAALSCLALAQKISLEEGSSNIDGLQTLINTRKPPEIVATVCQCLAVIGHPNAIPYLSRIIKNGPSSDIYEILDPDEYDAYEMTCRYYALKALPLFNYKDAVNALVLTTEMNDSDFDIPDFEVGRGLMGLISIGAQYADTVQEQTYTSTLLLDPLQLDLDSAILYKGNIARFWFLQERIRFIKLISYHDDYGEQAVIDCYNSTLTIRQKLVLALVLLMAKSNIPLDEIFIEGSRSNNIVDRILAYDGLAKLAFLTKQIDYVRYVQEGLNDTKSIIRLAVAGAVLLNNVEALVPRVLNMIDNSKLVERKALVRPLITQSLLNETWAFENLKSIYQREPNNSFRETLFTIIEAIPEIRDMLLKNYNENFNHEHEEDSDKKRPTWSFLNNK